MKRFTVDEPVFKTATLFMLGCEFADFKRELRDRYRCDAGDDIGQIGQMFTFKDRSPWRCVWTRTLKVPIVLHEVFHLVTRICEDRGIPIRAHADNGELADEAAAYLFECFATAVLRKLPGQLGQSRPRQRRRT